jgi:hypothetical protein
MDARELERSLRLLILPPCRPRDLQCAVLESLGLGETPHPPRHTGAAIQGAEEPVVIVRLHDLERLVGELRSTRKFTVEGRGRFRERAERPALQIARPFGCSLLRDDAHLVAHDGQITELPRGTRRQETPPERRFQLSGSKQELAGRNVRLD